MPPGVSTVTSTVPAAAGDVAVHEVTEQELLAPGAVSNWTRPWVRSDPVTVTVVPPSAGPPDGLIPLTTGTGAAAGADNGAPVSVTAA
jgi:hypothetical protein